MPSRAFSLSTSSPSLLSLEFQPRKKFSRKVAKLPLIRDFSPSTMKKSGFFAASVAAASATAISSPSSPGFFSNSKIQFSRDEAVAGKDIGNLESQRSSSADKFAPRFDGLRFIETLVTAHR